MSFTAICPFCGATYPDIEEGRRGAKARCSRCNGSFRAMPVTEAARAARQRARELRVPFVRVAAVPIDPLLVQLLPLEALRQAGAIPVGRSGDDVIVAMAHPEDLLAVDDLRVHHPHLKPALGLPDEIDQALDTVATEGSRPVVREAGVLAHTGGNMMAAQALLELQQDAEHAPAAPAHELAGRQRGAADTADTPARRAIDGVLAAAVERGVSEVRFMQTDGETVVQGRTVQGLETLPCDATLPYHQLMARLKDAAGCDPATRGEPQSGAIPFRHNGKEFEFLLNVLPARGTERAQLRLLDASTMRQRRAVERKQLVENALGSLRGTEWAMGSGLDVTAAKDIPLEAAERRPAPERLVLAILEKALENQASDVVIEPYQDGVRVLTRGSGDNFDQVMTVPVYAAQRLLAALQIMGNIDLMYSHQRVQKGLFYLIAPPRGFEVRIATLPVDEQLIAVLHLVRQTNL